jgi:hypothetical protein
MRVIQWKYNRGTALPEQVPEEFRLPRDTDKAAIAQGGAARSAYWAKLREEWLKPENWYTAYKFDLSWSVRTAQTMSQAVLSFIHQT